MQLHHCVVSAHRGVVCAFDSAVCLYSFEMAQIKGVDCVSLKPQIQCVHMSMAGFTFARGAVSCRVRELLLKH